MKTRANPEDEAKLAAFAAELADAIDAALPGWVERSVARFVRIDGELGTRVRDVGRQVQVDVGSAVRTLLTRDVDEQRTNPLAIVRRGVRPITALLQDAHVPPVERDELDERMFPDDIYGLTPASFADIDPSLHEPGLRWGAAKAYVFLQRRRREGRR
ncbi:MAG TPA: hypothetical protein VF183_05995 [Acidimicrobiales bacterium]